MESGKNGIKQVGSIYETADIFMHEYGMSLKEFKHDYTPKQIKELCSIIYTRKARESLEMLRIQHGDPKETAKSLDKIININKKTEITDEIIERFNIKQVKG